MIFELSESRLRVMGTVHLLPAGRALPAWVRSSYEWSEAVFIEHSPSEFLQLARLPDPVSGRGCSAAFRQLLSKAAAGHLGNELDGFQRGATVLLALAARASTNAVAGADQALHDWCQVDGKPFGYLEQAAQVLKLLNAIEEHDWNPAIEAEIAVTQSAAEQLQRFYDLWRKGRLAELAVLSRQGLFSSEVIRARLLTERNRAWACAYTDPPRRSLVAVGAAHLVGPGNFLETLSAASGRSVRRIV